MIYGSVCSGIESATVAWHPLGWRPAFYAENDAFPSAVLAHRWPNTPNLGDITRFGEWPDATLDILVGGTPCQSFSIAGLRAGIADPRGNLALVYLAIAARYRPRWLVWENVPGVLSADGGRAFGAFIGGLGQLGYGYAWRVLDAQYFGLAQRRKRVFLVGCLGGWARAAAVLFERESLLGHPAPSRKSRQNVAGTVTASAAGCSADDEGRQVIAGTLHHGRKSAGSATAQDAESGLLIAHSLRADGFDASEDGSGRGTPLVPVVFNMRGREEGNVPEVDPEGVVAGLRASSGGSTRSLLAFGGNNTAGSIEVATACRAKGGSGHGDFESETFVVFDETQITSAENRCNPQPGDPSHPLAATARPPAIAFDTRQDPCDYGALSGALSAQSPQSMGVFERAAVRRLTPRECERLQGFEDDYTLVPYRGSPAKDGPRYKALGNSKAVPVVRWIGRRIALVDAL